MPEFTKEEYIHWKANRPSNAGDWKRVDCVKADNHVKSVACAAFADYLAKNITDETLRNWIYEIARVHFGSIDVDNLFIHLNLYPDYI